MSTAAMGWRPLYDATESVEQFAARQRQAFAAFEVAWREGRVSIKLKGYYDQLVRDVGANAYAWWTEERWAAAFGVSPSTIKRVLAALTQARLIRRERQFGSSSRTYLISYDPSNTDNHYVDHPMSNALHSQHDIINEETGDEHDRVPNQKPEALQEHAGTYDYRQTATPFFGATSEPTIGSLLPQDHVKDRNLTDGTAGNSSPSATRDPHTQQLLTREGVDAFAVATQLATHAAGELQAVSRYLDTQRNIRDRPRLFAWLTLHNFGRQLLASRRARHADAGEQRGPNPNVRAPKRTSAALVAPTSPPAPPTAHQEVWAQVVDQFRSDATVPDLALWLDATVLLDVTDTTAVIGAPNVFQRDALQQRYRTPLEVALGAALGQAVSITVAVDGAS